MINENKLMMSGGYNIGVLFSCEMLDLSNNDAKWISIANMNVKRKCHSMTQWKTLNENIVVVGGWNEQSHFNVEEYDCVKDKWSKLPNTLTKHSYNPCVYSTLSVGNELLIVIGDDGTNYKLSDYGSIEFYDKRVNKWQLINTLPNMLNLNEQSCKRILFQCILPPLLF
jgi:hypothetical protein